MLDTTLFLAGLRMRFLSDVELDIDLVLNSFIIDKTEDTDVTIRINRDWDEVTLPDLPELGKDMLCSYYRWGNILYCLARGGSKGPVACSIYDPDCREILCVLNEKPFLIPPYNLGSILRMIPLRAIYQRFGVLFLHSSSICYKSKAILFTAPSSTGKTTQARLWNKYRDTEILCNDRTLLRKVENIWQTYGYPIDGSEPVCSSAVVSLGAVVLLAQGSKNYVERLGPGRGAALLMGQSVIDVWNPDARKTAAEEILSLMKDIPVYLLTCTPDERAVQVLETKLIEDEVIPNG